MGRLSPIEAQRREFRRVWPELYDYVAASEAYRALDRVGDQVRDPASANVCYRFATQCAERALALAEGSLNASTGRHTGSQSGQAS